ncbi:hypothetical protein RRG08_006653 [Elysia crispata]|uniref:Uncharacterized protein n=1 Tax=Elysia crispata TaxID=231223 RepID=A0AAE0YVZ1_9GAST|nr:hypothetical protein RRG08_006653 [Elysia crispata]
MINEEKEKLTSNRAKSIHYYPTIKQGTRDCDANNHLKGNGFPLKWYLTRVSLGKEIEFNKFAFIEFYRVLTKSMSRLAPGVSAVRLTGIHCLVQQQPC